MRLKNLPTALLLVAGFTTAQAQAARPHSGWSVSAVVAHNSFNGATRDTVTIPGTEVSFLPASHFGMGASVDRHLGRWRLGFGLGYLSTHLLAKTGTAELRDKTEDWYRLRAEMLLSYTLLPLSHGALALGAGPAIDGWSTGSFDGRIVAGGQLRLSLDLDITGSLALVNQASIGWSGSPFTENDTPAGVERKTLRTLELGAGLRVRL